MHGTHISTMIIAAFGTDNDFMCMSLQRQPFMLLLVYMHYRGEQLPAICNIDMGL